jgi:ATP-dependent DNA helicase RecQ
VGRVLNLRNDVLGSPDPPRDVEETVEAVIGRAEAQRRLEQSRVEMMRAYAETTRCRMEFLLAYFGEQVPAVCGRCDTCASGTAQAAFAAARPGATPYDVGADVDVEGDTITVLFDDVGYRTLAVDVVERKGLLEAG